jgi:hypothetical protein
LDSACMRAMIQSVSVSVRDHRRLTCSRMSAMLRAVSEVLVKNHSDGRMRRRTIASRRSGDIAPIMLAMPTRETVRLVVGDAAAARDAETAVRAGPVSSRPSAITSPSIALRSR